VAPFGKHGLAGVDFNAGGKIGTIRSVLGILPISPVAMPMTSLASLYKNLGRRQNLEKFQHPNGFGLTRQAIVQILPMK
jgi:hypothetical protein